MPSVAHTGQAATPANAGTYARFGIIAIMLGVTFAATQLICVSITALVGTMPTALWCTVYAIEAVPALFLAAAMLVGSASDDNEVPDMGRRQILARRSTQR